MNDPTLRLTTSALEFGETEPTAPLKAPDPRSAGPATSAVSDGGRR